MLRTAPVDTGDGGAPASALPRVHFGVGRGQGEDGVSSVGREIFLIDFENVQPTDVGRLVPGTCSIKLFLGQSQIKVPLELSRSLQPFGADVEYVSISGSGPNAVDFHIAFYIGHLANSHPDARFTIVSGDTGFDPLVRHLSNTLSIACRRIKALPGDPSPAKSATAGNGAAVAAAAGGLVSPAASCPPATQAAIVVAGPPAKGSKKAQVTVPSKAAKEAQPRPSTADVARFTEQVIERLKGLKAAKPATLKTLTSSLTSWAKPEPGAAAVEQVLASLKKRKLILVEGTKVSYQLK